MLRRALTVVTGVVLVVGAGRMAATAAHDAGRRDLTDARLARAGQLIRTGDRAAARTAIDEAICLDSRCGRGFVLRAVLLNAEGQHDRAAAAGLEAAERDPDCPDGWREAGRAFLELGDHDRAAECLAVALLKDPHDQAAHDCLVRVLEKQGRHEQARAVRREVASHP
jgi:Tfp pilus assembly protein PilF